MELLTRYMLLMIKLRYLFLDASKKIKFFIALKFSLARNAISRLP